MASTLISRHVCDRCGRLVEIDVSVGATSGDLFPSRPEGWRHVILTGKSLLYCEGCVEALRVFEEDAARSEQSR
jgi:hypothetical protein